MFFDHLPLTLAQDPNAPGDTGQPTTDQGPPPATDAAQKQPAQPGQPTQRPGGGMDFFFVILLGGIILMIFFSMRAQRRERRRRDTLLGALQKGDKVQTIGGILGTVVEVRDQRVILKVDENTNTRMQFARSAVQAILEDKGDTQEASKTEMEK